ncbi:PH domain-containing protein [Halomonas koreensis]|uniref:GRAM domain-containing protein n=1 Tax=Halomonas koreensis TaxID=245385 RepID=A0ABU1G3G1_9GAMM|nr:hypothetical protein [Halomonas koreensis]MDR5867479.1 hypothetical protein [Halomonas koreensis]
MQENFIKSSVATIQNGVARADGKLYVTETNIYFEPYNKKLGLGPYELERNEISKVEKCLGKGGGIFPVTSDAIQITLLDGSEYQFILANPKEWINLLSK